MNQIIIKGEYHISEEDYEQEKAILEGNITEINGNKIDTLDAVLFEKSRSDSYSFNWYNWWFKIVSSLYFRILESRDFDKSTLEEISQEKGYSIDYSRESDAEILEDHPLLSPISLSVSFVLFLTFVVQGVILVPFFIESFSNYWGLYFLSFGFTLLGLLIGLFPIGYDLVFGHKREQRMKNKIQEFLDGGYDTIFVVTGERHMSYLVSILPNDPVQIESKSGMNKKGNFLINYIKIILPLFLYGFLFYLVITGIFAFLLDFIGLYEYIGEVFFLWDDIILILPG